MADNRQRRNQATAATRPTATSELHGIAAEKARRDELQKLPPTALIVIRKTPRLRPPKLRTELLRFCCSVAQTSGRSDTIASSPS
jgi:hypothetical protein